MVADLDNIFLSEENYRKAFEVGLENMLGHDELGAYILVLANACNEKNIYQKLASELNKRFETLSHLYRESSQYRTQSAPDDVAVFEQLMSVGFDRLELSQYRHEDCWQLQYNPLRSFRPSRNSTVKFETISKPFDELGFNFNKPFLKKEIFWQGELLGRQVNLLYNKFPFAPLHGLLVIDAKQNKPQFLFREDHQTIWSLLEMLCEHMPSMGVAYNSLGAYSSVNHQHFQSFVSKMRYPVELACWQHNGGEQEYPINCMKFFDFEESWSYIDTLHKENIPYNLFYRQGEVYCINRAFQGSYLHEQWTGGFAWAEVFGSITTSSKEDFENLENQMIRTEMLKLNQENR